MNLDELISKYIDGELTEYEDDFLRQRISTDKLSRNKFDDAINLSIAFKEDANSIRPPSQLIEKTEDIVLMKILGEAPEYKRRRTFVWSNATMLAASIIALMFLMVFQISDYTFHNKSNTQKKTKISDNVKLNKSVKNNQNDEILTSITKSSNKRKIYSKKRILKKTSAIYLGGSSPKNFAKIKTINKNITMLSNGDENNETTTQLTIDNPVFAKAPPPTEYGINNLHQFNYNNNYKEIAIFDNNLGNNIDTRHTYPNSYSEPTYNNFAQMEVQVSSFFGTDIVKTGKNAYTSVISHFSQSVAYALNENERFGVELGYTEYAYDEKAIVNVKKKMGSFIAGIESNESGYGFSIDYQQPIVLKNSKQIIWASVFYEKSFLSTNSWALIGRLGFGATNEGPLGYGRIFTKYNLFSIFDLTLGAEGRLYSAQLPKFVGDNNKFNASCSLIYGFQFKF